MRLEVAVQHGLSRSKTLSAERLINLYAEQAPTGAKAPVWLVGTPGLVLWDTISTGPIRGIHFMAGVMYVVSGTTLYSVTSGAVETSRGTISGTDPVIMADNGTQLSITANSLGWIYTVSGGLVSISDGDFPGSSSVDYLDGYFIHTRPSTGQWFISALLDGTAFDAADFATAESRSDNLKRVIVDHQEVLLFGETTTEIWFHSGASPFPFERVPQAIIPKGLASTHAVARLDNSVYWLDHEGVVRRIGQGYVAQRVSTHAIETLIPRVSLSTAIASAYSFEGHEFFVLTIPSVGTYVFDASTGLWHERVSATETRWRVGHATQGYDTIFVGDFEDGKVYYLSSDIYTENGTALTATIVFPPLHADGERFTLHDVQLDVDQTSAPVVTLETSRDATTWTTAASSTIGTGGDTQVRGKWRRLGQFYTAHLRFIISGNYKRGIYAAYANITADRG